MKHVTNDKHSILRNKLVSKKENKSTTPEIISLLRKPDLSEDQMNHIHKANKRING